MKPERFAIAAAVLVLFAGTGTGQDIDKLLETASQREEKGIYQIALEKYREAAEALVKKSAEAPEDAETKNMLRSVREGLMRCLRMTGAYEDSLAQADLLISGGFGDEAKVQAAVFKGEILFLTGKVDESKAVFEDLFKSNPRTLKSILFLGLVEKECGRREEAYKWFDRFTQLWLTEEFDKTDENLLAIALGAMEMTYRHQDMAEDAQRIIDGIIEKNPKKVEAHVALGNLLMTKYVVDRKSFNDALKINPNFPDARVGLAACYLSRYDNRKAMEEARRALQINPRHVDALLMCAAVDVSDQMYDAAAASVDKALAVNPRNLQALSMSAGIDLMKGRKEKYEETRKRVLGQNPIYGEFYHTVAAMMQGRRLEEVVALERGAVKADPMLWIGHIDLGISLSRMGLVDEAKKSLEIGFKGDSYHVQARNLLTLFDDYGEFVTRKTGNFEMLYHKNDQEVMAHYTAGLLERAWKEMSERYGFKPRIPVRMEMFRQMRDFATRTIGLPGLGALGACFGPLITMNSPYAFKPDGFNWASTAWHEFAHVVTLQQSDGRIPRWFTEGISVYEERLGHPSWYRNDFREFMGRAHAGKLIPIGLLNPEFTRGRVLLAYFHASWVVEFIASEFGFAKVVEMIKEYGRDKNDAEAVKGALGIGMEELDRRFQAWLMKRFGRFELTPLYYPEEIDELKLHTMERPDDAGGFLRLARACLQNGRTADAEVNAGRAMGIDPSLPGPYALLGELFYIKKNFEQAGKYLKLALEKGEKNYAVHLLMGHVALNRDQKDDAIGHFEKSLAAFPEYIGDDGPYVMLKNLYESKGQEDKMLGIMEELALRSENNVQRRLELAFIYRKKGMNAKFIEMCRQIISIWPYRIAGAPMRFDTHFELAKALLAEKKPAEALDEAKMALSEAHFGDVPSEGKEEVEIRLVAAEAAIEAGDKEEAGRQIDEVLEVLDPGNEKALELRKRLKGE